MEALVSTRREYDHLFSIYVPIAIGVFLLIVLVVAISVVIFRRRPVERAARWHEHNLLEGSYAVLLACVAAFLLYLTFTAEHQVDTVANRERPALTVDVTASKWEWTFTYPAYGFSVRSGTVGRQPLVVPADEPVRFNLTSADVIHSFWIPALRYKHDAHPGRHRGRHAHVPERSVPRAMRGVLRAPPRRHDLRGARREPRRLRCLGP